MKFYLLKMKVNGIKNINKEVELDFYKNTLSKKFDAQDSHVKAIYGPNGAGKTGLIYAVEIYKNLMLEPNYLAIGNANGSLYGLINQTDKRFTVEMTYAVIDDDNTLITVYSHYVCIDSEDGQFVLAEEKLSELVGSRINVAEKYRTVYHTEGGIITEIVKTCKSANKIVDATRNLLSVRSLTTNLILFGDGTLIDKSGLKQHFACLTAFVWQLTVVLNDTDKNYINFSSLKNQIKAINAMKDKLNDNEKFSEMFGRGRILRMSTQRILKTELSSFEKYIVGLTEFIRVFKSDLREIEIKKDENGEFFECEKIMVYTDGKRINEKYESTGIKKVIELYGALCDIEHGRIVFIDEFDANLHDVLLSRFVEYVKLYAEGQFVFTTHNLSPMEILQRSKFSIDFLSPDSRITQWKINGNYSASCLYKKGLIEYSPFNIEAFSFMGTFGGKQ